jgi:hypothetical protein
MKLSRIILVVFGLLDAVLVGRFMNSISLTHFQFAPECLWWFQVIMYVRPFFLLSLGISAFGLALERRWGLILSYVQFPLRFAYVYLSFGFLTTFVVPILGSEAYKPTIIAAMCLEGVRLVGTIILHVRIAKLCSK